MLSGSNALWQREQELGRDDLIFPFRYIDISDLKPDEVHDPAVLVLLNSRQRFDFASLRHRSPDAEEVVTKVALLATALRAALRRTVAPEAIAGPSGPPAHPSVPREPSFSSRRSCERRSLER